MHSLKCYAPLDGRYAERVAISRQVHDIGEVLAQPHRGEGITKNLSISGCQIISE